MTIEEARLLLDQAGVPSDYYVLEPGSANATDFLGIEYEGKDWFVYYSERGEKTVLRKLGSQGEATAFLVSKLLAQPNRSAR